MTLDFVVNQHQLRLIIEDESAIQFLLESRFLQKPMHLTNWPWHKVGGLFFVSIILIFIVYKSLTPFAYWAAKQIPFQKEEEIFGGFSLALINEYKCENPKQVEILNKLRDRLVSKNADKIVPKIMIINFDIRNAFAIPGGHVILTKKLIDEAKTPSELAGVLAHEIEHIRKRHVLGEYLRSTLFVATWAIIFGDYTGFLIVDPETAMQMYNLSFSRRAEEEADAGAIEMLQAAQISNQGFVDFFAALENLPKNKSKVEKIFTENFPEFLSTHPNSNLRIEKIKQVRTTYSDQGLSNEEFAVLKEKCSAG